MVSNDRYQIVGESLVKNSQDTVFTLGMATFVANCVLPVIEIKANPKNQPMQSSSSKPLHESTFIDLGDSSNEDGNFGIGSNLSDACE